MFASIPACDVELIGFVEHIAVEIGSPVPHHDLIVLRDPLAANFRILGGCPSHVDDCANVPKHLLNCVRNQGRILDELLALFGKLRQCTHSTRNGISGGLVASQDHQHEEPVQGGLRKTFSVNLGVRHHA